MFGIACKCVQKRGSVTANILGGILIGVTPARGLSVASNFLAEAAERCLPVLRNQTPPPQSGRTWTRQAASPTGSGPSRDSTQAVQPAESGVNLFPISHISRSQNR